MGEQNNIPFQHRFYHNTVLTRLLQSNFKPLSKSEPNRNILEAHNPQNGEIVKLECYLLN